jgi:hypothetical protein
VKLNGNQVFLTIALIGIAIILGEINYTLSQILEAVR